MLYFSLVFVGVAVWVAVQHFLLQQRLVIQRTDLARLVRWYSLVFSTSSMSFHLVIKIRKDLPLMHRSLFGWNQLIPVHLPKSREAIRIEVLHGKASLPE
jgi:hypothetical protein